MPETPPDSKPTTPQLAGGAVAESVALMARLRGPDGCPWDREQTFDTIKRHTLEETYEVFDAIERRAWPELRDELGDLFLQVLFYAQMAEEAGHFNLADVAGALNAKLVRRHPHIFGNTVAADSSTVLRQWEQIKQEEKRLAAQATGQPAQSSSLDSIPRSMPAMLEATKLGAEAAKAGFDWPDTHGLFDKLREETAELHAEVQAKEAEAAEGELGDLLFTALNLARHLGIDPEAALRRTNAKFRRRYARMENLAGSTQAFKASALSVKDALWTQAKRDETTDISATAGQTPV